VVTGVTTASVLTGLSYQGGWNASTNTPTLASGVGVNGYYYVVTTAGSTNLDGVTDWQIGDWAIFNGTTWQKIDQTNTVTSVNGQVGVVVLGASDVGAQPADAQLTDIAGLTPTDSSFIVGDGTNFITESGSTARTSLGAAASGANADITSMTSVTGGISSPDFIQFDAAATVTDATAKLYYDNADQFQTLSFQMNGSVVQKIGEETYYRVRLSAPATKGQVLMFTGTLGASGGLEAAPATGLTADQSNYILGVAAETGTTNDWIFVTEFGEVKNINTTGGAESWVQGQVLYYNPAVTGGLTKTKPVTPNAIAVMAAVVHVSSTVGIVFVRPNFGSVLGGTDGNVQFGTLNNGDVIVYDSTDQRWENAAQSTLSVGSATTATTATTATNIAGGSAGTLPYQSAASTTAMLAAGTADYVLKANGAAAPSWAAQSTLAVGSATDATNVAITEDTAAATAVYPAWVTANTGNLPLKVTSTKLSFIPSTGALTATGGISGGTF